MLSALHQVRLLLSTHQPLSSPSPLNLFSLAPQDPLGPWLGVEAQVLPVWAQVGVPSPFPDRALGESGLTIPPLPANPFLSADASPPGPSSGLCPQFSFFGAWAMRVLREDEEEPPWAAPPHKPPHPPLPSHPCPFLGLQHTPP